MSEFREKAIFVWNDATIGSADRIVTLLKEANFEAAYLHSTSVDNWRTVSRVALANALRAAGITVYASVAVYGYDPEGEGAQAAAIVEQYQLAGCVFDVEAGLFESSVDAPARVDRLFNSFEAGTARPAAFCWWFFWKSPLTGTQWHNPETLRAGMRRAAVGMPMAYWSWGDDPASAVRFLEETWRQWREVTNGPIVMAGRAYLGDGGTPKPDAVLAYDARARQLGAAGMTWWAMEYALNESAVPGVWAALSQTPKFNGSTHGGENMWEKNALIAAFEPIGSEKPVASIDFSALKSAGVHGVILRAGYTADALNYDEPIAGGLMDGTYAPRFLAAKNAGLRILCGYDFSAVLDSVNAYTGIVTLRFINSLISGALKPPAGGALVLNCEKNTWFESIAKKTCTSVNYGKDLSNVTGNIWPQQKLVPVVRTGRWFLDSTDEGGRQYRADLQWLDNRNYPDETCPMAFARWKKTKFTAQGDLHGVVTDVLDPEYNTVKDPTGKVDVNEQAYYLYFGNHSKWRLWEVATVYHPAVKDALGNPALFRLLMFRGTPEEFDTFFNFPAAAPADSQAPSVPAGLAMQMDGTVPVLTWSPSTDNVGVSGYRVFRDGAQIGLSTGAMYHDSILPPGTYQYQVAAYDAAGNVSEKSAALSVTISDGGEEDPVDPTIKELLERIEAQQAQLAGLVQTLASAHQVTANQVSEIRSKFS